MNKRELVYKLMEKNKGLLDNKSARENGIDSKFLQRMCNKGEIERVSRGIYLDANSFEDEYLTVQLRCQKCIFSHETALYLHDLSDRVPTKLMITIPSGHNTRLLELQNKYIFFYIRNDFHDLGLTEIESYFGNLIKVYDVERTICDCIKKRKELDADLVITAIKRYMKYSERDLNKLLEYATLLGVKKEVKQYMEVLI